MYRPVPIRVSRCLIAAACLVFLASCATQRPQRAPIIERSTRLPPGETSGPTAGVPLPGEPAEQRSLYYTVEKGDTLFGIAQKTGRDPKEIAAWNNIEPPYSLRIGQVLAVGPPDGAAVAVPVTPAPRGTSAAAPPPANTRLAKMEPLGIKRPYSDATLAEMQSAGAAGVTAAPPVPPSTAASPPPATTPPSIAAVPQTPEPKADAPKASEPADANIGWIWPVRGKIIEGFSQKKNKGLDIAGKAGDPVLAAGDGKVLYAGAGVRGYGNFVIIKHNSSLLSVYAHNNKLLVKERDTVKKGQQIAEMGNSDADRVKLHFEIRSESKPVDPLQYLPSP